MRKLILLLIVMASHLSSHADDGFQKGIEAFNNKNYKEAIAFFEEEITVSGGNSTLYYNLGTAYLESNNTAKARLYLERALVLEPTNQNVINNLNIVIDRVSTTIIPLEEFFLQRWWFKLQSMISPTMWSILSIFLLSISLGAFYLLWFKNLSNAPILKPIVFTSMLLMVISMVAGISRYNSIHDPSTAIVMKTSTLKSSPSDSGESISTLSPGVKLKIKETTSEWIKVNTMNLEEGWIKVEEIEKI